jgi:precorrin-2 dehydrogenase/sirohydrochlorin ferrochelatase
MPFSEATTDKGIFMFPVILNLQNVKVALIGGGDLALQRLKDLDLAGVKNIKVFADNFGKEFWDKAGDRLTTRMPEEEDLKKFDAVVIVDLSAQVAGDIANKAKSLGLLINVEDQRDLSDFFFPTVAQRGDLILSVNTSGWCPVLAEKIKNIVGKIFHNVWAERADNVSAKISQWEAIGLNRKEIALMADKYIDEKGWLSYEELAGKKEEV